MDARAGVRATAPGRPAVPRWVVISVAAAWAAAVIAEMTGTAELLHHDALLEADLSWWSALVLFVGTWQLMIVAMMLPSTVPLIRLFGSAAAEQPSPKLAMAVFIGAYALLWSAFGVVAFAGDVVVHRVIEANAWARSHEWLLGAGVLGLAGAFQFTDLKQRCLTVCRHPAMFMLYHYRRGTGAAFRLGIRHGAFCLGCCWAVMLVMFAVGVSNLVWMAALTALMVYEKIGRLSKEMTQASGVAFLTMGAALSAFQLAL